MGYFKKDLSGDEEQELPARILQETWSRELWKCGNTNNPA
jgi:hypothetical protein